MKRTILLCFLQLVGWALLPTDGFCSFSKATLSLTGHNNPKDGMAYLQWQTGRSDVPFCYKLDRKLLGETWKTIDSVNSSSVSVSYVDSVFVCHDSVTYRVRLEKWNLVNGVLDADTSQILSLFIEDKVYPLGRELDSVSVGEHSLRICLGWRPAKDPDVWGYILTREEGGFPIALDTLSGVGSTYYEDFTAKVEDFQKYRLRVIDRCGNESINSAPKQIFATKVHYAWCEDSLQISFTVPKLSLDAIDSVCLMAKYAATDTYQRLSCRSYSQGDSSYFAYPASYQAHYIFYKVCALNAVQKSSSSSLYDSAEIVLPPDPAYLKLKQLSVEEDRSISLSYALDTTCNFNVIRWEKKGSSDSLWRLFKALIPSESKAEDILKDVEVQRDQHSYIYRGILINICGLERICTPVHQTIYLSLVQPKEKTLEWKWNTYRVWQESGSLDGFALMAKDRGKNNAVEWSYISATNEDSYIYRYTYLTPEEVWTKEFWIEARCKQTSLDSGFVSTSNRVSLSDGAEAVFFMPSGFKPGGKNPFYAPIGWFLEEDKIEWFIFNRQGKLIFESRKIGESWDGKYKGEWVHPGVYAYRVVVVRAGLTTQKTGSVVVVDPNK